jgi:hypothetical protein
MTASGRISSASAIAEPSAAPDGCGVRAANSRISRTWGAGPAIGRGLRGTQGVSIACSASRAKFSSPIFTAPRLKLTRRVRLFGGRLRPFTRNSCVIPTTCGGNPLSYPSAYLSSKPGRNAPAPAGLCARLHSAARRGGMTVSASGIGFSSGADKLPQFSPSRRAAALLRNRRFADSPLEGDGFEPSVPGDTPWVPSWKMSIILQSLPAGYPRVRRCGDVMFRLS